MIQSMTETRSDEVASKFLTLSDIGNLRPPFILSELPFLVGALAPTLDQKTMEIHHGKHHQGYIDNLNKLLADKRVTANLYTIITTLAGREKAVMNNAGGHWNHTFFWTLLTGDKEKNILPDRLKSEIEMSFDSVLNFKAAFEKSALSLFGSGWVWLYRDANGKLAIATSANQENPLMDVATIKGRPIFTVDLWEHAYYLSYQNRRTDYLKAIWNVINWAQVDAYDKEVTAH